jgi:hypothetical protein
MKIIRITPAKMISQNNAQRGLIPLPVLEIDLLLKRIKDGGFSGEFLKDAYISTYSGTPFGQSLQDLMKLDCEGFRLFHQILHLRHTAGWDDESLYQILLKVREIN